MDKIVSYGLLAAIAYVAVFIGIPKCREYDAEFDRKREARQKKAKGRQQMPPPPQTEDGAPIGDESLPGNATLEGNPISREGFDPVRHPEQVYDLIAAAAKKYERVEGSSDVLPELAMMVMASWRTESSGGVGGQLISRRRYDIETDRDLGDLPRDKRPICYAVQEIEVLAVHRPKRAAVHKAALRKIADTHGYDIDKMYGSCGKSTKLVDRKNFGSALASNQILAAEWVADPEYGDKDPYDLYWSMHATAKLFRAFYDQFRAKGFSHERSIQKALSRYYGADPELEYWRKAQKFWREAYGWHQQGVLRQEVTKIARRSARDYIPPPYAARVASN